MQQQYAGKNIFGDFNLYGSEELDFKATQENLLSVFKASYQDQIKEKLKSIGIKLIELVWYSPKAYNFMGDSIDPIISVTNKTILKRFIEKNKKPIQELLNNNKSCDGYMALTKNNVSDIKLDDLDIIVLIYALKEIRTEIEEDDFFWENLVYSDLEEDDE